MSKKFAIPVKEGILDGHFGHCSHFALVDVENKEIIAEELVVAPPHEPGILPPFLADLGVTDVLAGGMGQRAIQLFNQRNVNVFVGAPQMEAKDLVKAYLDESVEFKANYCDH
jgi:predicted Fe-Mo cluster-binding NifX family protein